MFPSPWARLGPFAVTLLLHGCSGAPANETATPGALPGPAIAAPYEGVLPDFATQTPATEDVYRWAATNRSILQYFQCTCGCEGSGHQSNWNCYVEAEKPGGEYVWDPMSAG